MKASSHVREGIQRRGLQENDWREEITDVKDEINDTEVIKYSPSM